jgi:carboxyl-terminal processing protease
MKMKSIHNFKLVALVTVGFFTAFLGNTQSNNFETVKGLELMDLIYQNLDMHFVDEPKPGKLSKIAIDAMLKDLDPYTVYYHESNMEDYRLMTTGQYGGIGALIRKMGDYICISEPYEGNPAQKSGLKAGDKILEIDGNSMVKKSSEDVSHALKGPKGTTIQVKVLRNNKEELIIPITRDEIKIPDVPYAGIIGNGVGYIKLNSFTQTASEEVKKAFLDLKEKGMTQLVFDLRENGGGLLIEAVKIVNFFVPKDKIVVTTKGRIKEENQVYKTQLDPLDTEIPIVVLIDEGSASASEIVSGSLQDLDRAVIVGQTSYGKGLVQRTFDLKYGSKIKLTIAKYYTPSGRCVQKLEYYDKDEDERPKEIADSLIRKFRTVNGREVIDGRGIEPDVKVKEKEFSRLTAMLVGKNFIFNYATDYQKTHPTIAPAGEFKLTDAEYNQFKDIVLKDTFDYSTASEEVLKKMKKVAEEEGYYEDSKAEYEALFKKVTPSKQRDLEKFNAEIKELLENEIVSRYYYQKGRAEHAFRDDNFVEKAKDILQNQTTYNTILKK